MKPELIYPPDYHNCRICPRKCGIDRYLQTGYCKSPAAPRAARAALHMWEEPCISGIYGSGTVFFSGCTLRCCYCQNYKISSDGFGKTITAAKLSQIFLDLQSQKAHNINLVTATQYLPSILEALRLVKDKLTIPIVYNCGGYETIETIKALEPFIDIWLPDLKYMDSRLSSRYSQAADYFDTAQRAIRQMIAQTGIPLLVSCDDEEKKIPLMKKGVMIRHMILPGQKEDSIRLLHWMHDALPKGAFFLSLLSQYTPFCQSAKYPEINRRITTYEYEKVLDTAIRLGLTDGYMQEKSSAKEEYTPPFELQGL